MTEAGKLLFDKGKIYHATILMTFIMKIFELKGVKRGVITIGGLLEDLTYLNTLYYESFNNIIPTSL